MNRVDATEKGVKHSSSYLLSHHSFHFVFKMGIPSYFSQLVRKYESTLTKLKPAVVHNLYLDSNSIVYDAYHAMMKEEGGARDLPKTEMFIDQLVSRVIHQIETYIADIRPRNNVFIAFDGVPPMAKVRQQRTRRLKGQFEKQMRKNIIDSYNESRGHGARPAVSSSLASSLLSACDWDPIAITPGTDFMNYLNTRIRHHFFPPVRVPVAVPSSPSPSLPVIRFSGSDEIGEGEHKLFEFMRTFPEKHRDQTTVVYGLDADLIMLCLFHLNYCKTTPASTTAAAPTATHGNLYLHRESPHFALSHLEPNTPYYLDISVLADAIANEMDATDRPTEAIADYVFMCFLLGNDFMPHVPTLNIRNGGLDTLMSAYKKCVENADAASASEGCRPFRLVRTKPTYSIEWANVTAMLQHIAVKEDELMKSEHAHRNHLNRITAQRRNSRIDSMISNNETSNVELELEEMFKQLNDLPISQRDTEHRIAPNRPGWRERYYQELMFVDENELCVSTGHAAGRRGRSGGAGMRSMKPDVAEIVHEYLQCLEWTFQYYVHSCIDWRWYYPYMYAPLVEDTVTYLESVFPTAPTAASATSACVGATTTHKYTFFRPGENAMRPLHEPTLLMYVFPSSAWCRLPGKVREVAYCTGKHWLKRHERCGCGQKFMWSYCRYFWESHPITPPILTRHQIVSQPDI